jgi:hypothetical protein
MLFKVGSALLLTSVFSLFTACKTADQGESDVHEAWDSVSAPEIFGVKTLKYKDLVTSGFVKGSVDVIPWTDDYWPLTDVNMAKRYITTKEFKSFDEQILDVNTMIAEKADLSNLSPAEKYDYITGDTRYAVSRESWSTYESYNSMYSNHSDWSWMGICHGWAPAAYMEKAPKHAVLVKKGGREVMFYEGDIRGLLSKAWAINRNQGGTDFMGSRCNDKVEDFVTDANSRPVDGVFASTDKPFHMIENNWNTKNFMKVSDSIKKTKPYWIHKASANPIGDKKWDVFVYKSKYKYYKDWLVGSLGRNASLKTTIKFYRQCRDMNAGSFHLVLAAKLSRNAYKKGAFVADMVRDMEVWNHPVYAFKSEIGPLTPIKADNEDSKMFRAKGTTHIAKVETEIGYVVEEGPNVTYRGQVLDKADWENSVGNGLTTETMSYTLEFDKKGYVIGGEWDENTPSPDFIWNPRGAITDMMNNGRGSYIRASFVKSILNCSLSESGIKEIASTDGFNPLPIQYTECNL